MKGMITSLCLMVGGLMFFACESSSDDQVVVDIDIAMTFENTHGEDLLNPSTDNYIQPASIHVFYEIDGKRETYESLSKGAIMDNPEGFIISPPEGNNFGGKYFLKLFSNPTAGDHVVTIIEIDGHEDLTLVTQVTHAKGNTRVEKIWYNDNVVWATDSAQPKYVKIVY